MNRNNENEVLSLVKEVAELDSTPSLKQNLKDDLNVDSFMKLELITEIENQYNLDIIDSDLDKINTVEDLVNITDTLMQKKV